MSPVPSGRAEFITRPIPRESWLRYNPAGLSALEGVRAALTVAALIIVSQVIRQPALAWSAIAAFWTCLMDHAGSIKSRATALITFTLVASLTCTVGAAINGHNPILVLAVTAIWIFLCALPSKLGPVAGRVGTITAVVFVVSAERSIIGGHGPLGMGALFLLGGTWATVMSLVLWRVQPTLTMRAALAGTFHKLSAQARDLTRLAGEFELTHRAWDDHARQHRTTVRAAVETARGTTASLPRLSPRANYEGRRIRLLVETADRLLGRLVALTDAVQRVREGEPGPLSPGLLRGLARLTAVLEGFAHAISGEPGRAAKRWERASLYLENLRRTVNAEQAEAAIGPNEREVWEILANIVAELRTALTLAQEPSAPDFPPEPGKGMGTRPHWPKFFGDLTLSSPTMHHAVRSAITVTIAEAIVLHLKVQNGFWLTMTTVLMLQPVVAFTMERVWQRTASSASGGALAALVGLALHTPMERLAFLVPLIIVTLMVRPFDYAWYIFFLTPLFVLMADFATPGTDVLLYAFWRVFNTLAGASLALLGGFLLWPDWESERLPGQVAAAIEAAGVYLRLALTAQAAASGAGVASPTLAEMRAARRQTGLTSNAAELSLQRHLVEPNRSAADPADLAEVLAVPRRLAGIAAALWLRANRGQTAGTDGPAYWGLAEWVGTTAGSLAQAARSGSGLGDWIAFPGTLPPDGERIVGQFEAIRDGLDRNSRVK